MQNKNLHPSILRVHAIRLNQKDGSKFYAPVLIFGTAMRALRLSWKTSTNAKAYGKRVLERYKSCAKVGK